MVRKKLLSPYGDVKTGLVWGSQASLPSIMTTLIDWADLLLGPEWPKMVMFTDGQSDQRQMLSSLGPETASIFAFLGLASNIVEATFYIQ